MADKWPLANGNWSTAANWNGGTLPVDGDDIYLDNRTITLDQSINLPNARLFTTQRTGGTSGGVLNVAGTYDITLAALVAGTTTVMTISSQFTGNVTIPTWTPSATSVAMNITNGVGHNIVFTNCIFVGGTTRQALSVSGGSGSITFVGCTARGGAGAQGVALTTPGPITANGTLHLLNDASSAVAALNVQNGVVATLTGSCQPNGPTGQLIAVQSGGSVNYTCTSFTWGASMANSSANMVFLISTTATCSISMPDIVMHGQGAGPYLVSINAAGTVNYTGSVTLVTTIRVFQCVVAGSCIIHTGELATTGSTLAGAGVSSVTGSKIVLDKIRAQGGVFPQLDIGVRFKPTSQLICQDTNGNSLILAAPSALVDLPIPANVRQGISYNNGTQIGTYNAGNEVAAAVWSFATRQITDLTSDAKSAISAQVNTDLSAAHGAGSWSTNDLSGVPAAVWSYNTRTITAGGLTQADVRTAIGMAAANLDSQLSSIASTAATVQASISGGSVTWTAPVTAAGMIDQPIVIGDDYFAASSRAFDWYVDPGVFPVANATCFFGGKSPSKPGWKVQGTVSAVVVDSVPKWRLRFELANTDTGALQPATYDWSVELRGPLPEHMTQIRGKVVVVDSYTR